MKRPRMLGAGLPRVALPAALALVAALALPGVALAGGVSVEPDKPLPAPVSGQSFTVGFTIRSLHQNQPPLPELKPVVLLSNPATGEQVRATAASQGATGHYAATLTLTSSGDWRWQFQPYGADAVDYLVTMPSLHVRKPGEAPPSTLAPNPSKEVDAKVRDSYFDPVDMTVSAGSTVTWTNVGQIPHTVTADDGSFASGNLKAGQSFSFTFSRPGVYHYYCEYHGHKMQGMRGAALPVSFGAASPRGGGSGMEGTVTVVEAEQGAKAPQAAGSESVAAKPTQQILAQVAPAAPATAPDRVMSLPETGRATSVPLVAALAVALAAVAAGALFWRRARRS